MKSLAYLLMALPLMFSKDKDIFSTKSIENRMVKVADGLYANKYETTNAEYREFLEWVETSQPQQFSNFEVKHDGWDQIFNKTYKENYFTNKGFDQYPVVNVTYESAQAFCQWLTNKYNSTQKRKFEEVKFRLPSREEWLDMAYNGRNRMMAYPWGGPYLKNRKGCYLATFRRVGNESIKMDINNPGEVELTHTESALGKKQYGTTFIMSPAANNIATGAGLHNLSGNAAEMLLEKGHTKGGSWGSSGYYLRIQAEDEFEGVEYSPYVGFRYVMEVVKE